MKSQGIAETFTAENGNTISRYRARDALREQFSLSARRRKIYCHTTEDASVSRLKKESAARKIASDSSCGIVRSASRLLILTKSEAQDALGFNSVRRVGNIVEGTGGECLHVRFPFSQM
jgi:hypothetical protein